MTTENTLSKQDKKSPQRTLKELFESDDVKEALQSVAIGVLNPERMTAVAYQCILKTPALMECSPTSLITALKTLAQMGCEPDGIHGYLVPHNTKTGKIATPIPSARGLMRTARANGITGIAVGTVRMGDVFTWGMDGGKLGCSHVPCLWSGSEIQGYYCTWFEGDLLRGVLMSKAEVDSIRRRSKAADNGPWVTDYEQMAHKTVIKRASKQWDLPVAILDAMRAADDIEFDGMRNVTPTRPKKLADVIDPTSPPPADDDEEQDEPSSMPENLDELPDVDF